LIKIKIRKEKEMVILLILAIVVIMVLVKIILNMESDYIGQISSLNLEIKTLIKEKEYFLKKWQDMKVYEKEDDGI
jgi:hypothetical protein